MTNKMPKKPKRGKRAPVPAFQDAPNNLTKPAEPPAKKKIIVQDKPSSIKSLKEVQKIVRRDGKLEAHPKGLTGCKAFSVNLPPEIIKEINLMKIEGGYRYMNELALEAFAAYLSKKN